MRKNLNRPFKKFVINFPANNLPVIVLVLNEMVLVLVIESLFSIEHEHRHTTEHEHEIINKSRAFDATVRQEPHPPE